MTKKKSFTERAEALGITRQAVYQADLVKAGKCVDCGRRKPKKGQIRCKQCLHDRARRARERRKEAVAK